MNAPTFSIILESANLSVAELSSLQNTLRSLNSKDLIEQSNEVLLMDSGDVPEELLQESLNSFPWLRAVRLPAGTGYEELKMAGARMATGEIIVMADGDCVYQSGWLNNLLAPFSNSSVDVVGGHTEINSSTAYGLAVKIAFSFSAPDRVSTGPYETDRYHLNNVAFRKSVLERVPIPSRLSCYRMTGIHAARLKAAGFSIFRQPSARTVHAPPNGFIHFAWRFLLFGHDAIIVPRLIARDEHLIGTSDRSRNLSRLIPRWFRQSLKKLFHELKHRPSRALELPVVLAICGAAVLFQIAGAIGGLLFSKKLLQAMPEDIRRASTCQAF